MTNLKFLFPIVRCANSLKKQLLPHLIYQISRVQNSFDNAKQKFSEGQDPKLMYNSFIRGQNFSTEQRIVNCELYKQVDSS